VQIFPIFDLMSYLVLLALIAMILSSAIKVVREYERGVIFRLGRLLGAKGPGLFFIIPVIDKMIKVDLRTVTLDVPAQEIITKDNVPTKVNAVVYFRVMNPENAIVKVENYLQATSLISQTTLRSVLGQSELDELLAEREKINAKLQRIIDEQTDPWGIKVTAVEIKDVELPEDMKRAMARQAEAERERRAKVISATGEFQAAEKLAEAAKIISKYPAAIQLRFLQTVTEATSEKASTLVIPVPVDIVKSFLEGKK
jgi:regulator of protease activity HflC (stomatin/prohibitin superfamily)